MYEIEIDKINKMEPFSALSTLDILIIYNSQNDQKYLHKRLYIYIYIVKQTRGISTRTTTRKVVDHVEARMYGVPVGLHEIHML